ncbi:MAG TPA: preprotein translocase subunit SecE [Candidatus Acidoferrales bacterium]|jgi:preprotein translocase subunit SecE|nr:preprotein translocase subunit SecE [Candidatus Acidoferrales bacterium]
MAEAAKRNKEEAEHGVSGFSLLEPLGKLAEHPRRLRAFFHDVRIEMRQVNWPTPADVVSTTVVVTVTVAFFGIFFFLVDTGVGKMIRQVLEYFQK